MFAHLFYRFPIFSEVFTPAFSFGFIFSFRFDTVIDGAPLIFSDQFIQISTRVPSKSVYGLGERYGSLNEDFKQWKQLSVWNRDQPPGVRFMTVA